VDKKPFYINLIGLCFSKFQEQKRGSGSIENFFVKKTKRDEKDETSSEPLVKDVEPPTKRLKMEEDKSLEGMLSTAPPHVDPSVWSELPLELQQELMRSWLPQATGSTTNSKVEGRRKDKTLMSHFERK
jgi:hypothetical protein